MEMKRKEENLTGTSGARYDGESGLILVVSAPSGAGKTTICREFLKRTPTVRFSVSFTTRKPRNGEVNGSDYHFISENEFRKRIAEGEFVEWEINYGYLYGTSKECIGHLLKTGYDLLLDVDTRGAENVKSCYPDAVFVFILPPSMAVLRKRLQKRGSEDGKTLEVRLERAWEEVKENKSYDYVIFNDKIKNSVDILRSIYVAEKNKRVRLQNTLDNFV
jgi:guanylate kinase